MEQDLKGVVVNEAPVGLQSHAPTKPQRESSPVSRTKKQSSFGLCFLLHVMEQDLKGVVVNEAPVGLQSHAPTKPQRESSPVSRTIKETSFVYPRQERLSC